MHLTKDNIMVGDDLEFMFTESLGTFQQMLLQGSKVVQIDPETGKQLTAIMALKRALQLAKKLIELRVKKGDVVTINSANCIEYISIPMACFHIGAIFAPINPDYTKSELAHVMNLTKPKVAFCSLATLDLMQKLRQDHHFIKDLIVFGEVGSKRVENVIFYEDIVSGVTEETNFDDFPPVEVNTDDVACIMCSSGTTGLPKGVMLTHKNITSNGEITRSRLAEGDFGGQSNVGFAIAPMFHLMGFMSALNALNSCQMIVIRKFTPKLFLECIQKYKVNTVTVSPPVVYVLLKHPLAKKYDLSSLSRVRCGAASLSKEMEQAVMKKFNLNHISQCYGLTETSLVVLMSNGDNTKPGSVGHIVPSMMCKVIDKEGKALGPNQEGELCFKGRCIMKGYINNPKETANAIDADGWLHSGDIGFFDNDYFFYVVSRVKELIKYNGFQVPPAELEKLLFEHSDVSDAAVVGLPDPAVGELPLAYVVRKPGAVVTTRELQDYVADGAQNLLKVLIDGVLLVIRYKNKEYLARRDCEVVFISSKKFPEILPGKFYDVFYNNVP